MRTTWSILLVLLLSMTAGAAAQQPQQPVPQPFPRPGERPPARPAEPVPAADVADEDAEQDEEDTEFDDPIVLPDPPVLRQASPATVSQTPGAPPSEATLGLPVYPTATFITSYDAGAGQHFYLFGTNAAFTEMVAYYRTLLRQRGSQVFGAPPTHTFEVGRFRQDVMAFPPGVTIKDYTWGTFEGYLDPRPGADPARYRTIIQIVPPPLDDR